MRLISDDPKKVAALATRILHAVGIEGHFVAGLSPVAMEWERPSGRRGGAASYLFINWMVDEWGEKLAIWKDGDWLDYSPSETEPLAFPVE